MDDDSMDDDSLPPFFFHQSSVINHDDEALAYLFGHYHERSPKLTYERLDWNKHVSLSIANNTFQRHYHMMLESFNKLVSILRPSLVVDKRQSSRSSCGNEPIAVELVVGTGLRYLGGDAIKTLSAVHRDWKSYVTQRWTDAQLRLTVRVH